MERVACIGECMVELSEHRDGTISRAFGGDTLNTALYLSRLGIPVDYVTALGDDPFSDDMLRAWAAEGIGTTAVARVPGRLPGLYLIRTDGLGERQFLYWRDSAPARQLFRLPETPALADAVAAAGTVYLSGITLSLFDAEGRTALFHLLARARAAGARIVFDTNFRPRGWPDRGIARAAFDDAFRHSDLVLAGTEDHALLHSIPQEPDDPASAGSAVRAHIAALGVPEIVVKLAIPACTVSIDRVVAAAPVSDVVDTTAAGDSFAAAYLAARLRGHGPATAAAAGHRLAGAVIRHRGAIIPRDAMPAPDAGPDEGTPTP